MGNIKVAKVNQIGSRLRELWARVWFNNDSHSGEGSKARTVPLPPAEHRPPSFLNESEGDEWLRLPGWVLPEAAEELYRHAQKAADDGEVVEIGSYAGKSSICLARAVRDGDRRRRRVFCIDIGFQPGFLENLDRFSVTEMVRQIETSSLDAAEKWRDPISFLFIDGHHGQAHAYADFFVWDSHLVVGGILALDDTVGFFPGCTLQVAAALHSGAYRHLGDHGGVTFLEKQKPLFDRIGYHPRALATRRALFSRISARHGAMSPGLRRPVPVSTAGDPDAVRLIWNEWESEDLKELDQIDSQKASPEAVNTVAYLHAVLHIQMDQLPAAETILRTLRGSEGYLEHYAVPVSDLAAIRLAQLLDLRQDRSEARSIYEKLQTSECKPIAAMAEDGFGAPFRLRRAVSGKLLREYVLDSPFASYRRF